MKKMLIPAMYALFLAVACTSTESDCTSPLEAVNFTQVTILDNFWRPRIETNAKVTIPHSIAKCYTEGRVDNFKYAAGIEEGRWRGGWGFDDSDVYKVLEGMAYTYNVNKDEALRRQMDTLIYFIGAAQEDDGYLYTSCQLRSRDYCNPYCTYDKERYDNLRTSHEFYNMGHLYEAAVAHYLATGQRNFLDIAIKSADHIFDLFGPGKREEIPGHQEIEIGLLRLAGVTGEKRYSDLAKIFLDRRGHGIDGGEEYYQNHIPVIDQRKATGHAVRANYMYSAMTDIAIQMKDKEYETAVDSLWNNVINTKYYLMGGFGALYNGEAYGDDYDLVNASYAETCAAIAGVYWNQRMFLLHGQSKYIDVLERTLYNGLISGISLSGTKFFYPNPMIADGVFAFNQGNYGRVPWFGCSCCPTNDCRFISSVPGYVYATDGSSVYVNLYMTNRADIQVGDRRISLFQQTNYPWEGNVMTTVSLDEPSSFSIRLRIPSWAAGHPVPGDLYSYLDDSSNPPVITLNGKKIKYRTVDGYAVIDRRWNDGDKLGITFEMPVRKVVANDKVKADRGYVALERGPIVYCFEEVDNGKIVEAADNGEGESHPVISLDPSVDFECSYWPDFLGGVVTVSDGHLTAVPYCVWDNRGDGQMTIWLNRH